MVSEIVALGQFILDAITARESRVSGWQRVYDVYRRLGVVVERSVTATEHYLLVPPDAPFLVNTTSFASPVAKWVAITNEDFAALDEAVKAFLKSLRQIDSALEIFDSELKMLIEYHFAEKAQWCMSFVRILETGRVTPDGKKRL